MTLRHRQLPGHRMVARQGLFNPSTDPGNSGNGHGQGNGNGSSSSNTGPTSQPTSPSQTPSTTPDQPTEDPLPISSKTSIHTPTPDSTTTSQAETTTTTTAKTSSTSSTPSTSSTSPTSTTSKTLLPVTVTTNPVIKTATTAGNLLPSSTISAAPSASSSAAPSGGASTGTIIGGVVGGLAAIAIIGIIVSFILRRLRERRNEDDGFNPDEFVRPPNLSEPEFQRSSTFDPNPPNMAQLNRDQIVSTYSSPGMAGHGAYTYTQSQGAGSGNGALQERQNYAYGQGYDGDDSSDHAHGIYSSEPMAQSAYNPEAYGSYAYSTEGSQAVPQGGYVNYQSQTQQGYGHAGDDFGPLSSPYDNPAGGSASLPPALVAGAPAVAAGRSNTRSVYDDGDAYGGI